MTITPIQAHELTWGDDLSMTADAATNAPWRINMLAVSDFGQPVPMVEAVTSLLVDGDLAVVNRWGNREVKVAFRITGDNGDALAHAEAALFAKAAAARPDPLYYTPPSIDALPTVFEVVAVSALERDYDDVWQLRERRRHERIYTCTFECLPWVRDVDLTTIPAIPAPTSPSTPAVYEIISAISGTPEFTPIVCHTSHFGTVTEDSASLSGNTWYRAYAANTYVGGTVFIAAQRTVSTSLAGFPYLTVDAEMSSQVAGGPDPYLRVVVGTAVFEPVAMVPLAVGVGFRYYFAGVPNTATNLQVRAYWQVDSVKTTRRLRIFELGRTDRIEIDGSSGLQVARTAIVGGSAPTQAAISLDAGALPLVGSTALIYTGPNPVAPLRPFRTASSAVSPDTAMISGARHTLAAATVYRVPANRFIDSTYSLVARLSFTGTKLIIWQARIVAADGTDIPGSDVVVTGTTTLTNPATDPWRLHVLASIELPTVALKTETTHAVEITLTAVADGSSIVLDEVWPLDTGNGAVTLINEPSAFQLTKIELLSPQLDAPRQAVIGTWDGYGAQDITRLTTPGAHVLKPGLLHVFTATDMAKYAQCALTYYRRHGMHAAAATEDSP